MDEELLATIHELNQRPESIEAADTLKKLGVSPNPGKLWILQLAEAKAEEEDLGSMHRDDLCIYLPPMTSGEDLLLDLSNIVEFLTPEIARRLMEEPPNVDLQVDEMIDHLNYSLTREQWEYLGLRTVEY